MDIEEQIVIRNGQRFVLVAESEYRRLKALDESWLPPLPEPDEHGNLPALEATSVSIARTIIKRRRNAGLTQLELARLAHVRPETIRRLETVEHVPSVATIDKIDRALNEAEQAGKRKRTRGGKA